LVLTLFVTRSVQAPTCWVTDGHSHPTLVFSLFHPTQINPQIITTNSRKSLFLFHCLFTKFKIQNVFCLFYWISLCRKALLKKSIFNYSEPLTTITTESNKAHVEGQQVSGDQFNRVSAIAQYSSINVTSW